MLAQQKQFGGGGAERCEKNRVSSCVPAARRGVSSESAGCTAAVDRPAPPAHIRRCRPSPGSPPDIRRVKDDGRQTKKDIVCHHVCLLGAYGETFQGGVAEGARGDQGRHVTIESAQGLFVSGALGGLCSRNLCCDGCLDIG